MIKQGLPTKTVVEAQSDTGCLFLLNLRSFKYNCFVRIPTTFTQNFAYAPALSSTKLGEFFTISGKIAPGGRKDFGFPRLAKLGMK